MDDARTKRIWLLVNRRLKHRVSLDDGIGCWIWTGAVTQSGYGVIHDGGRPEYVHRVVYRLLHRSIPEGHVLTHTCGTRCCVNPAHLRPCRRGAVQHKGRPLLASSEVALKKLVDLYTQGVDIQLIAETLGVRRTSVYTALKHAEKVRESYSNRIKAERKRRRSDSQHRSKARAVAVQERAEWAAKVRRLQGTEPVPPPAEKPVKDVTRTEVEPW